MLHIATPRCYSELPPRYCTELPPRCYTELPPRCYTELPPRCYTELPPRYYTELPPRCYTELPPICYTELPPRCYIELPPRCYTELGVSDWLKVYGTIIPDQFKLEKSSCKIFSMLVYKVFNRILFNTFRKSGFVRPLQNQINPKKMKTNFNLSLNHPFR